VSDSPAPIYDSWNALELDAHGFSRAHLETWYLRLPEPLPDVADPDGLHIERVAHDDLADFERVSIQGFTGSDGPVATGGVHPPNADPRMTFWLGRVDDEPVCAAMSYETHQAVGLFGVTTLVRARGRGYAAAVTRRAIRLETGLPAVLNTDSEVAKRVYERVGFKRVGECSLWTPGPVSRTEPDAVRT
jgi:predicted GNAT family acetyltransferase